MPTIEPSLGWTHGLNQAGGLSEREKELPPNHMCINAGGTSAGGKEGLVPHSPDDAVICCGSAAI